MWTRYSERELLAAVLSIRSIMDVFSCSSKHTLLRPLLHNLCHFLTTALRPRKKIPLTDSKPLLHSSKVVQNEGRQCLWIASFWANLGLSLHFLCTAWTWPVMWPGKPSVQVSRCRLHTGKHTWICWDTEPCCMGLGARELRFQQQAEVDVKLGPATCQGSNFGQVS